MKLKRVVIAVILLVVMIFSSGCFSDMNPNGNGFNMIGNIQGFKANYRPKIYDYYDFYYDFANTTLDRLYQSFLYNANNDDLKTIYKQIYNVNEVDETSYDWKSFIVYFYSDVKYSTYVLCDENDNLIKPDGSESDVAYYDKHLISWNWNLDIDNDYHYFLNNNSTYEIDDIIAFYEWAVANNTDYRPQLEKYSKALQVVVLQIVLDKTPTVFTSSNIDTATDILGTATISGKKVSATGLMGELTKNGRYVGLNDQALAKIKQYILTNIIGAQKFNENNDVNCFESQDYEKVIDTIWQDHESFMFKSMFPEITMEGCVFDEYPATYIKDYASNSFFINSNDSIAFSHIESAEYQSIVVMPSDKQYLEEIWFFLASDKQFDVNYYTRYYNNENDTLYVSDVKTLKTVIEEDFVAEQATIGEATFANDIIKLNEFNNEIGGGVIKATNAVQMNYQRSQYYTAENSLNGEGVISVLNPSAFGGTDGCSFVEIVFDVQQPSQSAEDFDFKVGFFYYGIPSRDAIRDFENK